MRRPANYSYSEPFAECALLESRVPAVVIPLTQGQFAFVDPEEVSRVATGYTWSAQSRENGLWYAIAYVRGSARNGGTGRYIYMHALITGCPGTDHRDRNGLNNTKVNLRVATSVQNGANTGKRAGTSSRFKGVSFVPRTGRWRASLSTGGRNRHLGYFTDEQEAARVYDRAATAHFGEFAATNAMLGLLSAEGHSGGR